jgi:peptidoglycan/LPS O-acetylase OafA/YrhL
MVQGEIPSTSGTRGRLPQLDALRAIAVFMVIGRHASKPLPGANPILRQMAGIWERCGWAGVDLFFVLSGFLVSGLLFREYLQRKQLNVGRFLLRRGLKIYPAFYAFLLITVTLRVAGHHPPPLRSLLGEVFFLQNYVGFVWIHCWSLAVEEHFYILVAILTALLTSSWWIERGGERRRDNPFRPILVLFAVLPFPIIYLRYLASRGDPADFFRYQFPTHLRIDSLGFGVILAYFFHLHPVATRRWVLRWHLPLFFGGILLILPTAFVEITATWMHTVGFAMLYVGFGMILIATVYSKRAENSPALRAIGRIGFYSYSIYLWHFFAIQYSETYLPRVSHRASPWFLLIGVEMAGSVLLGIFMARLVEVPALAFRDRIFPDSRTAQHRETVKT